MKVTLTKAMKLKNRLVNRLTKLRQLISANNSVVVGRKRDIDVTYAWTQQNTIMSYVIKLKTQIANANQPIIEKLIRIQELKGWLSSVSAISTVSGKTSRQYLATELAEFDAILSAQEIQNSVDKLEKEIDEIQDELDAFNHTTTIEIDNPPLDF